MAIENNPSTDVKNTDVHTTNESVLDGASANPSGTNEANVDTTSANAPAAFTPSVRRTLLAKDLCVHTPVGDEPLSKVLNDIITGVGPNRPRYKFDAVGISNLFADTYKDQLRYVVEWRRWAYYNGVCWIPSNEAAEQFCKQFTRALTEHVNTNGSVLSEEPRKAIKILLNTKSRENILKDARSVYPLHASDFDKKTNLFNVLNGTLDLDTGILRPHIPDDLITKVAGTAYDPSATCDRWIQHINEVTEGDPKLAEYIQKAFGLALDGHNKYECFYILYGPKTRNGKSTTMETVIALMGDYAKSANPDTIAQKRYPSGGNASEDIARLAGVRLVNFAEPDKKMVLSTALVKTLTGNDTITARYLYQNSFEYKPQFLAFINTNHLPAITDRSIFDSDRVKVIPFNHYFTKRQRDPNLKKTLLQPQSLSGILNWMLEGRKLAHAQGIADPPAVIEATAQYRHDSDRIAQFIDDSLISTPGVNAKTDDVYEAYKIWCTASGIHYENRSNFLRDLGWHAKIGRSRSIGSSNLPNAISCVFDFSVPKDTPLTDEEFNSAAASYEISCVPGDSTSDNDNGKDNDSNS